MYPVTNAVKALFEAGNVNVLRITGTDQNGRAIRITDADVMGNGFNIDRYSCNGEKLEIGTAISAEMTLKLNNADGRFDAVAFEGSELFVEVGVADWSQANPTVTYVPCGFFTPDQQPRKLTTISISALDRMTRFDAVLVDKTPWTEENGNIIVDESGNVICFESAFTFPCTIANLVSQVCDMCYVPCTQTLSSLPNYNYQVTEFPKVQQKVTLRNIIQWCAGIMGTNAWIDWEGKLRFSWYGESTGNVYTAENRYSSDLAENDVRITGIVYTNTQNVTVISGTTAYALDMTGNYLVSGGMALILPNVKNAVVGFTYRPFDATVNPAPYLWPMDMVTFTDKENANHTCAVTNVNFGLNGATHIAGKGASERTNSYANGSGMTTEQAFLLESAIEAAASEAEQVIDDELTQEALFNRLTDNHQNQGIYLTQDGNIYVDATYIMAGYMKFNRLKGDTLTLGGLNNVDGELTIKDASGNTIGGWNKDGISISKGTIQGPNVTLGGLNNVDGVLTVNDANGNVIGTWDKDGISLERGTISGPLIQVGGANNANGTLQILDSTGTVKGTWDNDGFRVSNTQANAKYETWIDNAGVIHNYTYLNNVLAYGLDINDANVTFSDDIQTLSYIGGRTGENFIVCLGSYQDKAISCVKSSGSIEVELLDNVTIRGDLSVDDDLDVNGAKNRVVDCGEYGKRRMSAYETPTPMFGDVGEGEIGEDGLCYVAIDPVFARTIADGLYQVFLQKYGDGDCWVKERRGGWFVVQGTPGMAFGWEIKAKQRDFDQRRMDKAQQRFAVPQQRYGSDAAEYVVRLRNGRVA